MILQQPLAFIDVETTGIDPSVHEIIELGVVIARLKDDVLTVVDQFDIKIVPKHIDNADPVALRVNGYNESDWLFAVEREEALKTFITKTHGAIFVAHNIIFDYGFIEAALKQSGLEHQMHFHKIDTISMAFAVLHTADDINRYSLKALCEYFGIENARAHSAYADAFATYEVFKKLLKLP